MERLTISANDWHRLKSNRKVRASEQSSCLVFLKDQPEEAPKDSSSSWLVRSLYFCTALPNRSSSGNDKTFLANQRGQAIIHLFAKFQLRTFWVPLNLIKNFV